MFVLFMPYNKEPKLDIHDGYQHHDVRKTGIVVFETLDHLQ